MQMVFRPLEIWKKMLLRTTVLARMARHHNIHHKKEAEEK